MLSQNQMVKHRRIIERLYDSVCSVIVSEEYEKENGVTAFQDVVLFADQPCRLSQSSTNVANNNYAVSETLKSVSLYIAPELDVPAGSRIAVTYNGNTKEYKNSGESSKYDTYQKIQLERIGRWV